MRSGGYVIDFWGLGYEIAEYMGLLPPAIRDVGYRIRELRLVDGRGRRVAGFGIDVFNELTGGRFVTLGAAIFRACCSTGSRAAPKPFSATRSKRFERTRTA